MQGLRPLLPGTTGRAGNASVLPEIVLSGVREQKRMRRSAQYRFENKAVENLRQDHERTDFGVRAGELTTELPAKVDAGLYFIGRIEYAVETARRLPEKRPRIRRLLHGGARSALARGLTDVATCTHLIVLYWMDKSPRNLLLQVPGRGMQRGTFALRSPARPNPIAHERGEA